MVQGLNERAEAVGSTDFVVEERIKPCATSAPP
jgi:hypothetical protein